MILKCENPYCALDGSIEMHSRNFNACYCFDCNLVSFFIPALLLLFHHFLPVYYWSLLYMLKISNTFYENDNQSNSLRWIDTAFEGKRCTV